MSPREPTGRGDIELKRTTELVGHVGLSPLHGGVEVGFAVEQSQQRKGIATEAVNAMCAWGCYKTPEDIRPESTLWRRGNLARWSTGLRVRPRK